MQGSGQTVQNYKSIISKMQNNNNDNTVIYLKLAKNMLHNQLTPNMMNRFDLATQKVQTLIREIRQADQSTTNNTNVAEDLSKLSQYVSQKNNAVKFYVKQKYQSGFFNQYKTQQPNLQNLKRLHQESKRIKVDLFEEKQNLLKAKEKIIECLQKFQEHRVNKIPRDLINRECYRHPDYIDEQETAYSISSTKMFSQIDKVQWVPYFLVKKQKQEDKWILDIQYQIEAQVESLQIQKAIEYERYVGSFRKRLLENNKLYQIWSQFLKGIIRKQEGLISLIVNRVKIEQKVQQTIKYQKVQILERKPTTHELRTIDKFRFNKQKYVDYEPVAKSIPNSAYERKEDIIFAKQKIANKRNGQTNLFHPKSFLLISDYLYYHDTNDQQLKNIKLSLQLIKIIEVQKQFGGFFSREKKMTKVYILKDKLSPRSLQIQYSEREGADMFKQIAQYMAVKAYCNYLTYANVNEKLFAEYIYEEDSKSLDMTRLIAKSQADSLNPREINDYIQIWLNVLRYRQSIEQVILKGSKLYSQHIELILGKIVNSELKKLKYININNNNLSIECLKVFGQCISQFQIAQIDLSYCNISDQMLMEGLSRLEEWMNHIRILDLSNNKLTNIGAYFVIGVLRKAKGLWLRLNSCNFSEGILLQLINQKYNVIGVSMNKAGLNLTSELFLALSEKLENNKILKFLYLLSNQCSCDTLSLKTLLNKACFLEELHFEMNPRFINQFNDQENINEWEMEGDFII